MVITLEQPGAERPVRLLGLPIKLSRTPGDPARAPGPVLGQDTDAVLAAAGFGAEEIAGLHEAGAVAGPASTTQGSFLAP
jgi:crotonobetainyl-CoA:carnitine CoA-transferase CaiB-like acyl-CoA transferase